MVENLLLGFETATLGYNLLYLFIGCVLGTIVGVIPGLGPSTTISLLLPATFALGPVSGLIMLAGVYYGSQYGGSTTAILLNTPGESSAVMTCIDGHQMAKQGRAGTAIMTSAISSFIAGVIMVILMSLISPPLADLAFKFGPAEYTMLMLFAFVGVTVLTEDDLRKGLSTAFLGILLGCIGIDINSGVDRFTFDIPDLLDGIGFVTVAVGVIAFSEVLKNLDQGTEGAINDGKVNIVPTWQELKRLIPAALRGTSVGGFLGLLPGGGLATASYAAYVFDKKVSKYKDEFGKGAIEGVAAPEAANNAGAQAGFIPLMSLGLPESMAMALMLGAMMVAGIVPGPMVIDNHPDLFWGLTVSILIGNVILLILNYPLIKLWVQLLKVPYNVLYPLILVCCFIGVYGVSNNINDLFLVAFFAGLGYIFYILDLQPITFILGFILGPMLEDNFRRSLAISQGDFSIFVGSDVCLIILTLITVFMGAGIINTLGNKQISHSTK